VARPVDVRRTRYLLGGLILAHLVVISRQVEGVGGASLFARVVFNTFSPVQRAGSAVVNGIASVWSGYIGLRNARVENGRLHEQVRFLETMLQERQQLASEAERLRSLLQLRAILPLETTVCAVIARDGVPWYRTLTIDKGEEDGVLLDSPVISASGVVGRVVAVGRHAAKVQLLLDRDSGVGVRIERSRVGGVITGQVGFSDSGTYDVLMRYVPLTADVAVGDVVVTSGEDQLFPRGLLVGHVSKVGRATGLFRDITVTPSAGFERLEEVMVVRASKPDTTLDKVVR
jgi:rod shape-determining protein MreC